MSKTILIAALLIVIGAVSVARAEDKPADPTPFVALLEKLRQHPEVRAYAARAESSRYGAEGELGLPDPMLFIQEQDYPVGSSMSRDQEQKMIGFKQVIPAFGTRGAKSERLDVESAKNKLLGDYAYAAMKAQLVTALAQLERIEKQEKLLNQQSALFGSERVSLKGGIAANRVSPSRLSMTEAESADIELMRADLAEERHDVNEMLINMVGETPHMPAPAIRKNDWDENVANTYPVLAATQEIEMARKDVDLRESEFNPNFELQASYGRMNGGDNAGTVMVGMSIPLWATQNQQPKLSGAKSALRAAESDLENIKRQTLQKLTHLNAQIDASESRIKVLERKESLLDASRDAQTREYEAGKGEFSMPLKTRREMVSVRYQLAAEQAKRTALIADFNHYFMENK